MVNRIRYADRGYAGFFAAVKVDEAALDRVYEFDAALLEGVAAVGAGGHHAASDPIAGIQSMINAIDALDRRINDREEILGGLK